MHSYNDPKFRCPFYREHILPLNRVTYHCEICKKKYLAEKQSNKVFHCKHNYMHIFTCEEAWKAHETTAVCKKGIMSQTYEPFVEEVVQVRTASQKKKREEKYRLFRKEKAAKEVSARASVQTQGALIEAESLICKRAAEVSEYRLTSALDEPIPQASANKRLCKDFLPSALEEMKENIPPNGAPVDPQKLMCLVDHNIRPFTFAGAPFIRLFCPPSASSDSAQSLFTPLENPSQENCIASL